MNPSPSDIAAIEENAKSSDAVIFCSYNAWKNGSQALAIQSLLDLGKPMILIVVRDPLDASLYPKADVVITTFSPTAPSIQAACDLLR